MILLLCLPLAAPVVAEFGDAGEYIVGSRPLGLAAADLNGDGSIDLVTADHLDDAVSVLLGDGRGLFAVAGSYPTSWRPVAVAAADLDLDGRIDLVTANKGSDLSVLFGDGLGGFATPVNYAVGRDPVWVAIGNMNGDGRPDLVVMQRDDDVAILLAQGDGIFSAPVFHDAGKKPESGALADLNGDGHLDVVAANHVSKDLSVLLGDGLGGLAPAVDYALDGKPYGVVAIDVDRDGMLDLAVTDQTNDKVSVMRATAPALFGPLEDYSANVSPLSLVRGSFDGDCEPDLALTGSTLAVLPGDGAGGFDSPQPEPFDSDWVVTADFDGDLRSDVAVTRSSADRVQVLLGSSAQVCTIVRIRRSADPATVRDSAVHATALAGPFDDDAGLLTDGQPHFYVVEHAAGMELSLSLHTNAQLDTLRLGFNDGDPLSAAVDAVVSELTVDTTGAPADGVTPIRVTVVPCDVNGVPLGSGLKLTLDVAALTPASLAGPIVDHGDGSYTLSFVASTPGSGQLLLAVEGVLLAGSPGLDYY